MCCSESTYRALPCTRPERRSQAPLLLVSQLLLSAERLEDLRRDAAHRVSAAATDRPAGRHSSLTRAAALGPADAARHTSESSSAHNRTVHQAELYLRVLLSPHRVASSETSSLQPLLPVTSLLLLQILQTLHLQRCGQQSALRHNSHDSELVMADVCASDYRCVCVFSVCNAVHIRCTNSSTDRLKRL